MAIISNMRIPMVRSTSRSLEKKYLPAIAFFHLVFLLFLFLTPVEYVNCQHIYPDECLDFFGIGVDLNVDVRLNAHSLTADSFTSPGLSAWKWYASRTGARIPCRFLEESFQSTFTEMVLTTSLRC